jgi:hypothetical protein
MPKTYSHLSRAHCTDHSGPKEAPAPYTPFDVLSDALGPAQEGADREETSLWQTFQIADRDAMILHHARLPRLYVRLQHSIARGLQVQANAPLLAAPRQNTALQAMARHIATSGAMMDDTKLEFPARAVDDLAMIFELTREVESCRAQLLPLHAQATHALRVFTEASGGVFCPDHFISRIQWERLMLKLAMRFRAESHDPELRIETCASSLSCPAAAQTFEVGLRSEPKFASATGVSTGDLAFDRRFVVCLRDAGGSRAELRKRFHQDLRAAMLRLPTELESLRMTEGSARLGFRVHRQAPQAFTPAAFEAVATATCTLATALTTSLTNALGGGSGVRTGPYR